MQEATFPRLLGCDQFLEIVLDILALPSEAIFSNKICPAKMENSQKLISREELQLRVSLFTGVSAFFHKKKKNGLEDEAEIFRTISRVVFQQC